MTLTPVRAAGAVLVLLTATAAATAGGGEARESCFPPAPASTACAAVAIAAPLACTLADGAARCTADASWSARGHSPAGLPGQVRYEASARFDACGPSGLCRTDLVEWDPAACGWSVLSSGCGGGDRFLFDGGGVALRPGECADATLRITAGAAASAGALGAAGGAATTLTVETESSVCA